MAYHPLYGRTDRPMPDNRPVEYPTIEQVNKTHQREALAALKAFPNDPEVWLGSQVVEDDHGHFGFSFYAILIARNDTNNGFIVLRYCEDDEERTPVQWIREKGLWIVKEKQ